ncbi:MAG: hypothetical protein WCF92_00215 [bacterium]
MKNKISITLITVLIILGGFFLYQGNKAKAPVIEKEVPISNQIKTSTSTLNLVNENASGYIKSAYAKNGKNYIDIDYVEFKAGSMPWGTVVNNNPKIRTFEVSSSSKILLKNDFVNGVLTSGNYNISFDKLKSIISYSKDIRTGNPWNIVVKDNLVISITENFRS